MFKKIEKHFSTSIGAFEVEVDVLELGDIGFIEEQANKWLYEMERVRQIRDCAYINSDKLKLKADNLLLDGDTEEAEKALSERIALKNAIKTDNPYPEKPEVLIDQNELLTVLLEQYPKLNIDRIFNNG